MKKTTKPKKPYPISNVVNWYYGNYCTRKCFNKPERISECWDKLLDFAHKSKGLEITHKDFKDMMASGDISICKLKRGFKEKTISWSQFETFQREENFDPDRIE